ncbi:MAG: transcription termination/antitermination protein NusG [Clostridiales bacterium]|jgi:transcriptional antiterminator NusG|nr:hypothetical protein [Eubacteriales bacterium]MDD3197900.1 hypothetical protein [Eubacteriales bacterium]MDD3503403.1 hypothetical protein [Eubacteriales bacterium]MDD4683325.1 hypothetical protein [Eubacteriales bacterium]MDN5314453.1 transcription termination/antitermination protein NusG [Clostridiales bacterium]
MDFEVDNLNCYCIFCRSGQEKKIATRLTAAYPDLTALAAIRLIPEKRDGQWTEREHTLLPGYVFIYASGELPYGFRQQEQHIYKLLDYDEDMRTLFGEDRDYAVWIYKNQGCIAPSKVLCQGDQVTIVDGPLKECHGIIKRLDKHKRRAWVSFRFAGEERTVSLGVELLG